jgi:hypothetical protein
MSLVHQFQKDEKRQKVFKKLRELSQERWNIKPYLQGQSVAGAKCSASNHSCTCFGSLGILTINRNNPISGWKSQGTKAIAATVIVTGIFASDALRM